MPKLPEVVTKKIGPLPLWGWVVAGAGAVFIFSRFRGGKSSSGGGSSAGGIGIPVLTPSGSSSPSGAADGSIGQGGNAVGSPSQNVMGGTDTQPGGAAPWWSTPPAWWSAAPAMKGPAAVPAGSSPGKEAPGSATVGPNLFGVPLSPVVPSSIPPQFRGLYESDPNNPGQLRPKNQN